MPAIKGRTPRWSRFPWRSPLGIGLLLSFFLPILVLATVSAVSLRQRAQTRSLLVQERYGAVADLVSSKLDEEMDRWHRELLDAIDGDTWSDEAVVTRLHSVEQTYSELLPVVVASTEGRILYPVRDRIARPPGAVLAYGLGLPEANQGTFAWLMTRGEEAELRDSNLGTAVRLYRRALGVAPDVSSRTRAINAMARSQAKAGEARAAVDSYRHLVETADPMDAELGRWAVVGRVQLASAQEAAGQPQVAQATALDALRFLQRYRFYLDPDLYHFYRDLLERELDGYALDPDQQQLLSQMRGREDELDDIDSALQELVRELPQLLAASDTAWDAARAAGTASADKDSPDRLAPDWSVSYRGMVQGHGTAVLSRRVGTEFQVARVWRAASVRALLVGLLQQEGPWRANGVALFDPSGAPFFASTGTVPEERMQARLALAAMPGWRIAAYPVDGSIAAEARRDVFDYGVLLVAAFLAVVASLVVATRTLSHEVALARTRSDFVSNVSHELKTPLALIRMFAENLRSGWVPEEKKPEYYRVMLGESERLSGIIENVLDFSRIESGHREFRFRAIDLAELVSGIVERYRYSFESNDIELTADLPEEPVEARLDAESIEQVLVNLLSNAAKYIGDNDRQVRVGVTNGDDNVTVSVQDTGVGLKPESIEQIFDPFCRIDDPSVGAVAGSGIGLTIVRHIVDAHHGSIQVDSSPGAGSIFRVVLPRNPRTRRGLPPPTARARSDADG